MFVLLLDVVNHSSYYKYVTSCVTSCVRLIVLHREMTHVVYAILVLDASFGQDGNRAPGKEDFRVCESVVNFLEKFKTKTELVSTTSKPMAHRFFREILDIDKHLRDCAATPDFCLMGAEMRSKYDKYWGKFDKLNDYMYFAVLLDPSMKSVFIRHQFHKMIKHTVTIDNPMSSEDVDMKVASLVRDIEHKMEILFTIYKQKFDKIDSHAWSQEGSTDVACCDDENAILGEFLKGEDNNSSSLETELKRYLNEPRTPYNKDFDILRWWKQNASRYPIVSRMAKGIVLIISTIY